MIGIFILVQLLFSSMFFYAGSEIIAIIFLIICVVFLLSFIVKKDTTHMSFSQITKYLPSRYSYSPKHLLPASSLLFYIGIGLFIFGISIQFSISFSLIFGIASSLLSLFILFSYIQQKKQPLSHLLPTLHIILTTTVYVFYVILGQSLSQYVYIHAVTLILITLMGVFGLRKSIHDTTRSSIFFGSLYVVLVIAIVGLFHTYTNLSQGLYLVYIFVGIVWSVGYVYISGIPIHSHIHTSISNIQIGLVMGIFLIGIYYPSWTILHTISVLLVFGGYLLYEHIRNRRIFVFTVFSIFLMSIYTFFFYKIRVDISYIGFLITSSLLPVVMIASTFLYNKNVYEVYILHYTSIATMVIYSLYALIFLQFDILQTSLLLIIFSGIIFFSSKRLIDVR